MAFDPDSYLASSGVSDFDPDKYLAGGGDDTSSPPFDPDEYLRGYTPPKTTLEKINAATIGGVVKGFKEGDDALEFTQKFPTRETQIAELERRHNTPNQDDGGEWYEAPARFVGDLSADAGFVGAGAIAGGGVGAGGGLAIGGVGAIPGGIAGLGVGGASGFTTAEGKKGQARVLIDTYSRLRSMGYKPDEAYERASSIAWKAGIALGAANLIPGASKTLGGAGVRGALVRTAADAAIVGATNAAAEGATMALQNSEGVELTPEEVQQRLINQAATGAGISTAMHVGGAGLNAAARRFLPKREANPNAATMPERDVTLETQRDELAQGKRPAMLYTAGETVPELPEGFEAVQTDVGTFHFDPSKVTPEQIISAVNSDRIGDVLDYGIASKPRAEQPQVAVVRRDAAGNEIEAVVSDKEHLPDVLAKQGERAEVGQTIATEPAAQVLSDRAGGNEDLLTKYLPEAAKRDVQRELRYGTRDAGKQSQIEAQQMGERLQEDAALARKIELQRQQQQKGSRAAAALEEQAKQERLRQQRREALAKEPDESRIARRALNGDAEAAAEIKRRYQADPERGDALLQDEANRMNEEQAAHEQEQAARAEMEAEALGGHEDLIDAVKAVGGLPASDNVLKGELQLLRETAGKGKALQIFRKAARSLDAVREALSERGFHYDTPSEMLDAIQRSIETDKLVFSKQPGSPRKLKELSRHAAVLQDDLNSLSVQYPGAPRPLVVSTAAAIPDVQLRNFIVRESKTGHVEGFFFRDKIILLAQSLPTLEDARRVYKHEAAHHALRTYLKDDFNRLLDIFGKTIEADKLAAIENQGYFRKEGQSALEFHRELVEEYLAKLGEREPKSTLWRQFVAEVKRLLSRVFNVTFTDADMAAILHRARKRVSEETFHHGESPDIRLAKAKPGMKLREVGPDFVVDKVQPRFMDVAGTNQEITIRAAREFQSWPERIQAADGSTLTLHNPEGGSMAARLRHLIFDNETQRLNADKVRWLPNVPETLKNAYVRLVDEVSGNRVYARAYENGLKHMVVVRPDGVVLEQKSFVGSLITQFPDRDQSRRFNMRIDWVRGEENGTGRFQGNPRPTPIDSMRPDARQSEFQGNTTAQPGENQGELPRMSKRRSDPAERIAALDEALSRRQANVNAMRERGALLQDIRKEQQAIKDLQAERAHWIIERDGGTSAAPDATKADPEGGEPVAWPKGLQETIHTAAIPAPEATFREKVNAIEKAHVQPQSGLVRFMSGITDFLKGFRSAIPEASTLKPEERAMFFQGYRRLKEATSFARAEAAKAVREVIDPIYNLGDVKKEGSTYDLFRKSVMWRDLWYRSKTQVEGFNPDGSPRTIILPENLKTAEAEKRLAEIHAEINASPFKSQIEESLRRHYVLVEKVRQELEARGFMIPTNLQNPFYYPHKVLKHWQGDVDAVRVATGEDFRSYLMEPTGTSEKIESDYVTAMYTHMAEVIAHNTRADLVEGYWKPYDKMEIARREFAAQKNDPALREETWGEFIERRFPGYTQYAPDKRIPLRMELGISRNVIEEQLGIEFSSGDWKRQMRDMGVRISPEMVREVLAAGAKEKWLVPESVAKAIRAIAERESAKPGVVESWIKRPLSLWKMNVLYNPLNTFRYNYGNIVSDLEKVFSLDPGTFKLIPEAFRQVREFYKTGIAPTPELAEAFKRGVLNSVTADEVSAIPDMPQLEAFKDVNKIKEGAKRLVSWGRDFAEMREAVTRYAYYLSQLRKIQNGAEPAYGGALRSEIRTLRDPFDRAAEIAKQTFVDYNSISPSGDVLRKHMIPFYSWMEGNFRYHINLFRNGLDIMAEAGSRERGTVAAQFARKAAAFPVSFAARLVLPYMAVQAWNYATGLEDELSAEDRRRFHIILGKDDKGKVMVTYLPTALSDFAGWFSGNAAMQLGWDVVFGKITFAQAATEWTQNCYKDVANKALGGLSPYIKLPFEVVTGKSMFPDIFNQRTIPAYDMRRYILSQITDETTANLIEGVVNKDFYQPKDFGEWTQQAILQVRRRDPEQWAYYFIRDKVDEYLEARGHSRSVPGSSDQVVKNFRRAMYQGDVTNAMRFYNRLIEDGYTAEQFASSLNSQDPLNGLSKDPRFGNVRKQFVESLTPFERKELDQAFQYYARMRGTPGRAAGMARALFPSKRMNGRPFAPRENQLRGFIAGEGNDDLRRAMIARDLQQMSVTPGR